MKLVKTLLALLCALTLSGQVFAMKSGAHRQTLLQALEMLQKGDEKQRWIYGFYSYHASRNGTSPQATIAEMGPAPDHFLDTVIGGWWIGYRYFFELEFYSGGGYTSYWHFTSAYRPGKYGDRYSGYAYPVAPEDGFFGLNTIVKTVLHNQEIKSGSFENARGLVVGIKDLFQILTGDWLGLAKDAYMGEAPKGDWALPGAPDVLNDYQTQTASTDPTKNGRLVNGKTRVPTGNWEDIQDAYFNPGANAGQYWYNQFTHNSSFDNISEAQLKQLGYAMHWIADGATPQHVWGTSDHNHTNFEGYIDEYLGKGFKASADKVFELINQFENSAMTSYKQQFASANDIDGGSGAWMGALDYTANGQDGPALKDLKVNGRLDYTLVSAGDILRWLAEQAVQIEEVLADDSEKTFSSGAERALTLAVAGEILLLSKGAADLYKAKQYQKLAQNAGEFSEFWGFGTFQIGATTYNQIR